MKLKIDIDEAEYKTLSKLSETEKANELSYYERIIANGKPYEERPHGEWINHWDKGYVECPFCHKPITGGDLNFCVKCGADMRGKNL